MVEFHGAPAALAAVAVLGVLALAIAGLTFWWVSRNPKVALRVQELKRFFWASLRLALLAVIGLIVLAVIWAFAL